MKLSKAGLTVFDEKTGLTWQQSDSDSSMNYADAEKYVLDLNEQKFAGYSDWRLPTLKEAMSLMERENKNGDLYINPVFDCKQSWFWTADKTNGVAWFVDYSFGCCSLNDADCPLSVRAVRS